MRHVMVVAFLLLLAVPGLAHTTGEHANLSDHPPNGSGDATDWFAAVGTPDDPVLLAGVLAFLGLTALLSAIAIHLHRRRADGHA